MALVIKKPVNLSSLGDEYKGIELVFRSIPAKDLAGLNKTQEAFEKDEDDNPKLEQVLPFFIEILQKYFVSGKQDDGNVVKEDLGDLDSNALIHCFQILTGQNIDPKDANSLTSTSSTEPQNQ